LDKQISFDDFNLAQEAIEFVASLNETQVNIIKFLEQGDYQAHIAKRLGISRSHVNKVVRTLEKYQLIVPQRFSVTYKGKTKTVATGDPLCGRATTYTVTTKLKALIAKNPNKDGSYTLCIPHHLKIKYPVVNLKRYGTEKTLSELVSVNVHDRVHDSKIEHVKKWHPRGHIRHKFHIKHQNGDVGVEVHGNTLVAYKLKRQHIMAKTGKDATGIIVAQIHEGVSRFVREQNALGLDIELGDPEIIGDLHLAFNSKIAKRVLNSGRNLSVEGIRIDNSLEKLGDPDQAEMEIHGDADLADEVDQALRNALNIKPIIQSTVENTVAPMVECLVSNGIDEKLETTRNLLLHEFDAKINPINQNLNMANGNINNIMAIVQGGTTLQYQFNQMVGLLNNALIEMQGQKKEIELLTEEISRIRTKDE